MDEPIKRGRGRPKKIPQPTQIEMALEKFKPGGVVVSDAERRFVLNGIAAGKTNDQLVEGFARKFRKPLPRNSISYWRSRPEIAEIINRKDREAFQSGLASRQQRIVLHKRILYALEKSLFQEDRDEFLPGLTPTEIKALVSEVRAETQAIEKLLGETEMSVTINNNVGAVVHQNNQKILNLAQMSESDLDRLLEQGHEDDADIIEGQFEPVDEE